MVQEKTWENNFLEEQNLKNAMLHVVLEWKPHFPVSWTAQYTLRPKCKQKLRNGKVLRSVFGFEFWKESWKMWKLRIILMKATIEKRVIRGVGVHKKKKFVS